jgi:hypothetical protein
VSPRLPQKLKDQVRARAAARCEYCFKPEGISAYKHHPDHIIPPLHGGDDSLENLAWACFQCNTTKSGQIASYDFENHELTPLFNPRQQSWDEHFRKDGETILGITPVGRVTVRVLQLNNSEQLETRRRLINAGKWG